MRDETERAGGEEHAVEEQGRSRRFALSLPWPATPPLDLRILGRTLLHAALVGGLAGLLGAGFFAGLELAQRWLLEGLAGYSPARAVGETFLPERAASTLLPWVLLVLPALGGLASGLLSRYLAPETAGGGGDAIIHAYHRGGLVRRRVIPVKALAAILTLGTGGSGGREGPTMQVGGAIGALVGRYLPTTRRERRILLVAGIAAGIAAVFRTPLGAALLATEMMYRDDFESDALVPAVLASVVAYSVVIAIFGETTLFGHPHRFPFEPLHLVLYAALALLVALGGVAFLTVLRSVQRASSRLRVPSWLRPAVGGLLTGAVGVALTLVFTPRGLGGLGVFGGGYGLAQVALSGSAALPAGWELVGLFGLLFVAKAVASSLTIGSGGAAGDFAPSLVMGALLGAAFGHAAALVLHDPRIDPAAFALVGMGTFYGGLAHTPLAALVLVSELAGSYDLLVPMMLAVSVAFVALRHWTLYEAQPRTQADSPAHRQERPDARLASLGALVARDLLLPPELPAVAQDTRLEELLRLAERAQRQKVLVVVGRSGDPCGLVDLATLPLLPSEDLAWANAHDLMVPFHGLDPDAPVTELFGRLVSRGLPQLPVVSRAGVVGFVGETELARACARACAPPAYRDEVV